MSKPGSLSRREFLKKAEIGAVGVATMSVLSACAPTVETPTANPTAIPATNPASTPEATQAKKRYLAGSYTSTQSTGYATAAISCVFDSADLKSVSYSVTQTSAQDMFPKVADAAKKYEERIVAAGSPVNVDGIASATLCTKASKMALTIVLPRPWESP
jgi:uncharacterized protein with FMN-binding domain